jgi:hypothetical protein
MKPKPIESELYVAMFRLFNSLEEKRRHNAKLRELGRRLPVHWYELEYSEMSSEK